MRDSGLNSADHQWVPDFKSFPCQLLRDGRNTVGMLLFRAAPIFSLGKWGNTCLKSNCKNLRTYVHEIAIAARAL